MKIILTSQEYSQVLEMMKVMDENAVQEMENSLKANPLVSITCNEDFSRTIHVDHEYMAEYMRAATESASIIVPMAKGLVGICKGMFQKFQEIVEYHVEKHRSADKKAAMKHGEEAVVNIEDVLIDVVRLAKPECEKFEDLDRSLQRMLVVQYGETVKAMVNKYFAERHNKPFM